MLELANFFLSFSHNAVIIPFMIIGYIWLNKKMFFEAICLILLSIIINYALKVTFKIPLNPALKIDGYAFPSGHMQSSLVFYSWLAYKHKGAILSLLVGFLLFAIAWALKYMGYHNIYDILGSIFFGILWMVIFWKLRKISKKQDIIFIFIGIFLTSYIHIMDKILPHIYLALYALMGFVLVGEKFPKKEYSNMNKILSTIFCVSIIIIIKVIFTMKIFLSLPIFIYQLQWLIIGCIIPLSGKIIECLYARIFDKSKLGP